MATAPQAPPLDKLPVSALNGVGPRLSTVLAKLAIHTVQDVLFHLPLRYLDRTRIVPIADLAPNTSVVVQGTVSASRVVYGRRRSLLVTLQDHSGHVNLRFFHFNAGQQAQLKEGAQLRCYGDPRLGATGFEFYHPEYETAQTGQLPPLDQSLTPIYPLTDGLSQGRLRKLAEQAVDLMQHNPPEELLPAEINRRFGVQSLSNALHFVHFPPRGAPVEALVAGTHPHQLRLVFEELLAHHLALQQSRWQAKQEAAPVLVAQPQTLERFYQNLPFRLTSAQMRVIADIQQDLKAPHPMLRLVQGDVGSGKTLVAAAAALAALESGFQVAVVAPTEILAEQHYQNFANWLKPMGYEVTWLVGRQSASVRREALAATASGDAQVVVGTHALFQDEVHFFRLGMVIIDEQHRFGVHQRLALRNKAPGHLWPHQLVMTATPIPRTLAMTVYSDLDLSVIDELPPGRKPVHTVLINQQRRGEIIERVRTACTDGRQVYWVCTLIEDSEALAASAAAEIAKQLCEALPELNIGLVHGRLKSREKEAVMAQFKQGEIQLLVATTVIEVGVDVANASLMIIENPERLGLAQLHQLRGRVGRGTVASHCVLLYGSPLSRHAKQRLQVLRESNDGFAIAEHDLEIRGAGELLGTRQTGDLRLRLADLLRDAHLLPEVHASARQIIQHHPQLSTRIIARWFSEHLDYIKG